MKTLHLFVCTYFQGFFTYQRLCLCTMSCCPHHSPESVLITRFTWSLDSMKNIIDNQMRNRYDNIMKQMFGLFFSLFIHAVITVDNVTRSMFLGNMICLKIADIL